MTRTDYLTQLETYLHKLPEADRIEAMDYFKELFDDAGSEGRRGTHCQSGNSKKLPMISFLIFSTRKSMKPLLKE